MADAPTRPSAPTEQYSHGHHAAVLRSHRWRTAQNSAAYLLPHLRPGQHLLDVGCGPGTITVELAALVPGGRVAAVDNAAAAVDATRELAAEAGLTNVAVGLADAYDLPYADDSFDVVHAHQVLQHLADPVAALRELHRVTKPGGIVAARDADYEAMTWWPASPGMDRWLAIYREVARRNGGEPDAARRLVSWAHAAGFATVQASATSWCFSDAEDVAWWGGTWASRISETALADQAVAYGIAESGELAEIAAAWRSWTDAPDAWFAVLHGEILATA